MAANHNAHDPRGQALLASFARALRAARERRGFPLAELARRAELSRRFLTEAEAGRANPSLVTLARLAAALELEPAQLLGLERRRERIALIGLRGAGKSTIGRLVALELDAPFVELDQRVEELAGLSLQELFALHGEEGFRRLEAEALEAVLSEGERVVLAAGGSIVRSPRTFARLQESCRTVWLRARPKEHFRRVLEQGDRRPMANRPRAMAELEALLAEREPLYARAELAVSTSDRTPAEVASQVLARLQAREEGPSGAGRA